MYTEEITLYYLAVLGNLLVNEVATTLALFSIISSCPPLSHPAIPSERNPLCWLLLSSISLS